MKFATFASCAVVTGLFASPLPASAQTKIDLYKPAGPWAVDYGDDYCRLSRNFSDGTNTMAVAFERIQPTVDLRLILVGPDLKTFRSADEIGWHFLPSDPARKARATKSETADGKLWYNFGPTAIAPVVPAAPGAPPVPPGPYSRAAEQTAAKAVTGFLIDGAVTVPVQVDTGELGAPIAALQACADDLAKTWGLDPVKLRTQKSPAIPNGGGVGWLPAGTVAFSDFAKLGGGSNQVRLMVDATGKATSCTIHWPSLDQTTNDKICKSLMSNAKFTPASDSAGQAMPGYWVASPLFLGPPFGGGRGR